LDLTEIVSALPSAVNPFALSLNENPFPPLPGVRSALSESVEVANRYPEFLPERLRALIAGHVGVHEEQVVIGAGATGVIMHVLSAVTSPGDRMVMTSPTFDGYPIFAQMARLVSVSVALDDDGDALIAWAVYEDASSSWQVWTRRLSRGGTVGPFRRLSTPGVSSWRPRAALTPRGQGAVIFDESVSADG
jgi:histidinol-phosphate aminotransferase